MLKETYFSLKDITQNQQKYELKFPLMKPEHRERFWTLRHKWDVPFKFLPSKLREHGVQGGGQNERARGQWGRPENKSLRIKMSTAHMNSKRRDRWAQRLPLVLHTYIMASSLVLLWDCWVCKWVGLWLLCFLLGSFSSIDLSCLTLKWFFFCFTLL